LIEALNVVETTAIHKPSGTVLSLQVLRGVAALLVVFCHAHHAADEAWPAGISRPDIWLPVRFYDIGAVGVDIFFVISGFIMVYVSQPYRSGEKPASDFLIKRLIRIYPLYALMTLVEISLTVIHNYRHGAEFPYTAWRIIGSFGFIPTFNGDGLLRPILWQGWTLFYEMFFYVCFSLVLTFSKRHILTPLIVTFAVVFGIARLHGGVDELENPISTFFGSGFMFEFLYGCSVGLIFQKGLITSRGWLTCVAIALVLFACSFMVTDTNVYLTYWFLILGIPATILFVGFLKIDLMKIKWPSLLLLLGNASYSIYLSHIIFIYKVRELILSRFNTVENGDALILVLWISAICLGVLVYFMIEKPLQSWLNGIYAGHRRTRIAPVSTEA
jgi:exopolysaccharide production protein ExoZ